MLLTALNPSIGTLRVVSLTVSCMAVNQLECKLALQRRYLSTTNRMLGQGIRTCPVKEPYISNGIPRLGKGNPLPQLQKAVHSARLSWHVTVWPNACAAQVYQTTTYDLIAQLKGHPDAVLDLAWSADGIRLASVCKAAVYTWSMETFEKVEEDASRLFTNSLAVADSSFEHLVVADSHTGMRLYSTDRLAFKTANVAARKVPLPWPPSRAPAQPCG